MFEVVMWVERWEDSVARSETLLHTRTVRRPEYTGITVTWSVRDATVSPSLNMNSLASIDKGKTWWVVCGLVQNVAGAEFPLSLVVMEIERRH